MRRFNRRNGDQFAEESYPSLSAPRARRPDAGGPPRPRRTRTDRSFPLAEIADAFGLQESGGHFGKIVVEY
ncbi:zinc-binding dehydrogenase [Thalassospira tepidiphila]|uniref:zinc-binding dehydrogenase n=1 Tax=Thalassospira tepidiphila TaxID=393657 RepID=UPI003CC823AC